MAEVTRPPSLLGFSIQYVPRPSGNTRPKTSFQGVDGRRHSVRPYHLVIAQHSRGWAVASLIAAPVWIPLRAIGSIFYSLANIATAGSFSVKNSMVENTLPGRLKAMGSSLLSIITTPLNMVVEGAATVGHVLSPTASKVDLLAAHFWTGFVVAKREK